MESKIVYYIMISNKTSLVRKSASIKDIDSLRDELINHAKKTSPIPLSLVDSHIFIQYKDSCFQFLDSVESFNFSHEKMVNNAIDKLKERFLENQKENIN